MVIQSTHPSSSSILLLVSMWSLGTTFGNAYLGSNSFYEFWNPASSNTEKGCRSFAMNIPTALVIRWPHFLVSNKFDKVVCCCGGLPTTMITSIQEPTSMAPLPPNKDETIQGEVTAVKILAKPRCHRCHALPKNSTTHRCDKCKLLQRLQSYQITHSGVLIIKNEGSDFFFKVFLSCNLFVKTLDLLGLYM